MSPYVHKRNGPLLLALLWLHGGDLENLSRVQEEVSPEKSSHTTGKEPETCDDRVIFRSKHRFLELKPRLLQPRAWIKGVRIIHGQVRAMKTQGEELHETVREEGRAVQAPQVLHQLLLLLRGLLIVLLDLEGLRQPGPQRRGEVLKVQRGQVAVHPVEY